MLDRYVAQVRLLLSVLPDIATETVFALKGCRTTSCPRGDDGLGDMRDSPMADGRLRS